MASKEILFDYGEAYWRSLMSRYKEGETETSSSQWLHAFQEIKSIIYLEHVLQIKL
jgi:hypothetical protein